MAENKLQPTAQTVGDFIAAIPDEARRADALALVEMIERLSGYPPVVWAYGIVGFGEYHYRYDSGHAGRASRVGFSPRAKEFVIYLMDGYAGRAEQLARLGRHKVGKSCLYIRRLADVDQTVLEEMIADSLAHMRAKYPEGA